MTNSWFEQEINAEYDEDFLRGVRRIPPSKAVWDLATELGIITDPKVVQLIQQIEDRLYEPGENIFYPGQRVMYTSHPGAPVEKGVITQLGLVHPHTATHAFVRYDGDKGAKLTPLSKLEILWFQPGFIMQAFLEEAAKKPDRLEFFSYEHIGIGLSSAQIKVT